MRRTPDHLAELSVGRLVDLPASLHRFLVVDDELHGLVAPRLDLVADVCLDPFDDRGFEVHDDTSEE